MQKKIICCFVLVVLATSCASRRTVDESIIDNTREITAAETRIDICTERVSECAKRLSSCTGGIDEIIILFDEYQRRVNDLILAYNDLRERSKAEN